MMKMRLMLALFVPCLLQSQEFQGVAEYESKVILKWKTENDFEAEQNEQIKKALEKQYVLKFNRFQSLYEKQEKLARPSADGSVSNVTYGSIFDGPHFRDLKERQYSIATDIYDKQFLIVDSLQQIEWQLTSETKKIGDYTCYKATYVIKAEPVLEEKAINLTGRTPKDKIITAWYTPDIPVSHGPDEYWGLPGLILEVSDGQWIVLCSKLTLNPDKKFEIKAPKRGEKVTRPEFDSIKQKRDSQGN